MVRIKAEHVPKLIEELKLRLNLPRTELAKVLKSSAFKVRNLELGRVPSRDEIKYIRKIVKKFTNQLIATAGQDADSVVDLLLRQSDSSTQLPASNSTEIRRISNSEIQSFKRCRRKWWLTWYRGLRPIYEYPISKKDTGTRVHAALAAWYVPDGELRTDPRDALERVIIEDWTRISNSDANPEILDKIELEFQKATTLERIMIEGYMEWLEETGEDSNIKVVSPESYIEVPLPNTPDNVRIIGKIDVRVIRLSDGVREFIDHKTVQDFTTPAHTLRMNEQMLHYHVLEWLSTKDNETRCDGALYNMLRRVKRTAKATPPFYKRYRILHNQHQLQSSVRKIAGTVNDILSVESKLNEFGDKQHHSNLDELIYPTVTQDCNWSCPVFSVCSMLDDGSRAEDMISDHFVEEDPLNYYQNEKLTNYDS